MKPSFAQLTAFLRLAETHSFTEAAEASLVSQPAFSRTIQSLEQLLGARLFTRDTRNIELTVVGAELLPIAQRLVNETRSAHDEIAQVVDGRRGRLRVAALPSVAAALLPRAIARFRASHPDVDVAIADSLSELVLDLVADGGADIGLTVRPPANRRLSYRSLLTDRFCLVSRAIDAPAEDAAVDWHFFERRPFIAMSRASSVRIMTDAAFLQAGVAVTPLYECTHLSTTGGLVAAGLGITALPQLAIAILADPQLVARSLAGPVLDRSIGAVTRAGRPPAPAAAAFLNDLVAEAEALLATRAERPLQ